MEQMVNKTIDYSKINVTLYRSKTS